MSVLGFLSSDIIKAAGEAIDNLVTSDEERSKAKLDFFKQQIEMVKTENEMKMSTAKTELQIIQAKRDIIIAEAKADSWLTSNWRPIVILSLAFSAVAHVFGLDDGIAGLWGGHGITDDLASQFLDVVMVAVGGYIGSRGVEKGIKTWKSTPLRTFRSTDKVPPKEEESDNAKT